MEINYENDNAILEEEIEVSEKDSIDEEDNSDGLVSSSSKPAVVVVVEVDVDVDRKGKNIDDNFLSKSPIPCYILYQNSQLIATHISVGIVMGEVEIQWRYFPEVLGCNLRYLIALEYIDCSSSDAARNIEASRRIKLLFGQTIDADGTFEMIVEFDTIETSHEVYEGLLKLLVDNVSSHGKNDSNDMGKESVVSTVPASLGNRSLHQQYNLMYFHACIKQEQLYQLCHILKRKDAMIIIERVISQKVISTLKSAFELWTKVTYDHNYESMNSDRFRWRLHAAANLNHDLQAWYHTVFFQEVYRLRGPFWFRDAVLPSYRDKYDLVDNSLSALEEAALSHVMCSPDTTYGDVAGQMFVIQALAGRQELFSLFQRLASQGVQVTKYPRSGRPAKKSFRVSFVEGKIYLTWKGKFGNQGIDLSEVTAVIGGLGSDILHKAGQSSKSDQYLSILCTDRSVDLFFDTEDERNIWRDLMDILSIKERGRLIGIEPIAPSDDSSILDWCLYYYSIGSLSIPSQIINSILDNTNSNHNTNNDDI